ncbi:MAG: Gfo/Idh/MocA family oxidoreductase [Verrucomicrobia bacterium]|jgi:predicted dehydrogenase|nr:Gfo/Idh/MocA family oxidoreductase [Verrucomicrobiota bacterium]
MKDAMNTRLPRRAFLAGAATATVLTALKPSMVFGAEASSKMELGLIGCGGRGKWIANLFTETGLYKFVACADYFQDKVDKLGEKHGIEPSRRYTGLSGYKRLLDSKLDAVVIETPPYFHPQQAADAVDAGKHVFLAKPIAVDAPGCLTIAGAGQRATAKKLVFLVDFQTRANEHYRKAVQMVRNGDIGKIVMGEAHYPWRGGGRGLPPTNPEEQLRSWYYVLPISGDFIVEQSIHSLDVATWIINADPIRAIGTGGQKLRPKGSIWDHFAINYSFPDDVPLSFTCIQSIPEMKDEITARVYGSDGYIQTDYYSDVLLRGKDVYKGNNPELYTSGAKINIREFHQFIATGQYDNPTVAPSVRSNLTAILGREAGYKQGEITLAALIKEGKRLKPNLKGLKA